MAKMPARTLRALKGSIAKWEAIVAGTGEDLGVKNCPLCQEFPDIDCTGCPVRERTGQPFCGGSPYQQWDDETDRAETRRAATPRLVALAQAELDFLRSLLPEGE